IYVIGTGQQNVFLGPTLAAGGDKSITVLKVVVSLNGCGYVIAWIKRRAGESLDKADLIFADDCRIKKADRENAGANVVRVVDGHRLCVDAVRPWRQDLDLRASLVALVAA